MDILRPSRTRSNWAWGTAQASAYKENAALELGT